MFVSKLPETSKCTRLTNHFRLTCKHDHLHHSVPVLTEMCVLAGLPWRAKSDETRKICTNFDNTITYATIWKWNTRFVTICRKKTVIVKHAVTKVTAISQRSVKMNLTHNSQFTYNIIQMTWKAYHLKRFMPILTEMSVLDMLPWRAQTEEMWHPSMFIRECLTYATSWSRTYSKCQNRVKSNHHSRGQRSCSRDRSRSCSRCDEFNS